LALWPLSTGSASEGAALVPPPRTHRHRYFGVLAVNSPFRAAVTGLIAFITVGVQIRRILDHIPIGIWRRNPHRTLRSTDKSVGE
jgi:hypothetical protein